MMTRSLDPEGTGFKLHRRQFQRRRMKMEKRVEKVSAVKGVSPPRSSYSIYTRVGNLIFLAGLTGVDPETKEIPKSFPEQVRLIMESIKTTLESVGTSMDNILKTTVFLKDRSYLVSYDEIYKTYFKNGYPARSTVVADLMHPDFLIEIEATAWIP
jgi:2-iminobutanoate/2-iminopropanoate deaminase